MTTKTQKQREQVTLKVLGFTPSGVPATKKTTKKKATKKTGKAKRVNVGLSGPVGYQAARLPEVVPLPDALLAFDVALEKVQSIRSVLVTTPDDGRPVNDEVLANRARRLADAVSYLQHHAWTLRESAYTEADK